MNNFSLEYRWIDEGSTDSANLRIIVKAMDLRSAIDTADLMLKDFIADPEPWVLVNVDGWQ